ncbi:hypothetical protein [Nonomuraea aurantiaca]|uniref:hypothetical protein n=1 Tax=Nonomuraea aurantiaca TaxID=2878562 RepID=UPI001CD94817|nr:hypothetical protein [Nonomuraea aurantiaca]MCA2228737.1 hypothetical protein [Nonomuraea aurantiaca]
MRKMLTLIAAGFFLAGGMTAAIPAQASSSSSSDVVAATPLRYYETFYPPNHWWKCYDRGYRGINNGEWYDFQCRDTDPYGDRWVDLYIQVAP